MKHESADVTDRRYSTLTRRFRATETAGETFNERSRFIRQRDEKRRSNSARSKVTLIRGMGATHVRISTKCAFRRPRKGCNGDERVAVESSRAGKKSRGRPMFYGSPPTINYNQRLCQHSNKLPGASLERTIAATDGAGTLRLCVRACVKPRFRCAFVIKRSHTAAISCRSLSD